MTNNNSRDILNISSSLLGFCLVVLTSIKVTGYAAQTIVDELTGVACIFMISSGVFAFLSIRTARESTVKRYAIAADILFLTGLIGIFIITLLVSFSFIV